MPEVPAPGRLASRDAATSTSPAALPEVAAAARVAVIGGGPAGLMAAEGLASAGVAVDLYDAMPSVGRKFLLAGIGGLNLTPQRAVRRVPRPLRRAPGRSRRRRCRRSGRPRSGLGRGARRADLRRQQRARFPDRHEGGAAAARLAASAARPRRAAAHAPPLARLGRRAGALRFAAPDGEVEVAADAVVLALGGASRLAPRLRRRLGAAARCAQASRSRRCGRRTAASMSRAPERAPGWSEHFRSRFAGQPLKTVALSRRRPEGGVARQGEFVVTATGVEGSLVYAASALLRDGSSASGRALVYIDLLPARSPAFVRDELRRPRGPRSLATHLKSRLGIAGVKAGLLRELLPRAAFDDLDAPGAGDQGAAAAAGRAAPDRRGHQQRRRRSLRGARPRPDAAGAARRVLRRRDARLGRADRRLPADRMPGDRRAGGARRAGASAARPRRQPLNYNRPFNQSDKDEKGMLVMTPRTTTFRRKV